MKSHYRNDVHYIEEGSLTNLVLYKVTNPKEVSAILKLSDYGRKG